MAQSLKVLLSVVAIVSVFAVVPATGDSKQSPTVSDSEVDKRSLKLCRRQYQSRKRERALKHCIKAAKSGSSSAFLILGLIYQQGMVVVGMRDPVQYPELAYKSFLKAAELGHPQAHYLVGQMLENGNGVKEDQEAAWTWKQKALELGYKPKLETIMQ